MSPPQALAAQSGTTSAKEGQGKHWMEIDKYINLFKTKTKQGKKSKVNVTN